MKYFKLHIHCKPEKEIYDLITRIINVTPDKFESSKIFPTQNYDNWTYSLEEQEDEERIDFINIFLDLIEPNFLELKKLNIKKTDILIWKSYEYEHQCSMEFHPEEMKRLGIAGINLNIDCLEKKEYNTIYSK